MSRSGMASLLPREAWRALLASGAVLRRALLASGAVLRRALLVVRGRDALRPGALPRMALRAGQVPREVRSPARGHGPWALMIAAVATLTAGCSVVAWPVRLDQPRARPIAVVYRGPASCPGCSEAVAALIRRSPVNFKVSYIGPHEKLKLIAASLRGVDLYAQPGGNGTVGHGMRVLGARAADVIRRYVAGGGHYVGFCMGAYLAGSDPGMGLLQPGNTGEYDRTRGASVKTAAQAVIPVIWGGSIRYQYAQDPPYIIPA